MTEEKIKVVNGIEYNDDLVTSNYGIIIYKNCKCGAYNQWDNPQFPCQYTCTLCGEYSFWSDAENAYSSVPEFVDVSDGIETLEE